MENVYVLNFGDELSHHGIKGMKWGVRRYQNADGSLTAAGKKRRDKLQSKLDKLENKEAPVNSGKTYKKISDMSDEELADYVTRKTTEKMAYTLQNDINKLNPKKVSAGQQFANNLKNQVLGPAAMEAGKKLLTGLANKAVDNALGTKDNEAAKLKKQAELAGYQKTILETNRLMNKTLNNLDIKIKEAELEKKLADVEKTRAEAAAKRAGIKDDKDDKDDD